MDKVAPANVDSMVAKQSCNRLLRRRCTLDDTHHVYPVQAFYLGGGNDVATKARAETMHGQLSVLEAEGLSVMLNLWQMVSCCRSMLSSSFNSRVRLVQGFHPVQVCRRE